MPDYNLIERAYLWLKEQAKNDSKICNDGTTEQNYSEYSACFTFLKKVFIARSKLFK